MAVYVIDFMLDGEKHHTRGEMSYPTKEDFESKNYTEKRAMEIAMVFIDSYMDVKQIAKSIHPYNITYTIKFE